MAACAESLKSSPLITNVAFSFSKAAATSAHDTMLNEVIVRTNDRNPAKPLLNFFFNPFIASPLLPFHQGTLSIFMQIFVFI